MLAAKRDMDVTQLSRTKHGRDAVDLGDYMYINQLEKEIVTVLKATKQFKSVKRYAGELEATDLLRSAAGNIPAALVFTTEMIDCEGVDQLPAETLKLIILLLVSSDTEKSRLHELRLAVRKVLDGYTADGALSVPLVSVRTDAVAVTPTLSVYAMEFMCEVYIAS
jgi:hypothetical protein